MVVYDTIYYVLYTLLKHNVGCVLDGTFYQDQMRAKIGRICARFNAKYLLVMVTCPDEIIKKRFEEREKRLRRTLSDADSKVYERFKQIFEPTKLRHIDVDMATDHDKILEMINNAITERKS